MFCTREDFQEILCSGVVTNYPTGGVFVVLGGSLGFSAPTSALHLLLREEREGLDSLDSAHGKQP